MLTAGELVALAGEMRAKAYAPYSRFQVGAALECADGCVFTGCNIENAAYSPCICAERAAVCRAVCEGRTDFVRIAIISSGEGLCFPCGVCRQTLCEFNPSLTVLCADREGRYREFTLTELLPHAFGPKALEA